MSEELGIAEYEYGSTLMLELSGSLNVYSAHTLRNRLIDWASITIGLRAIPSVIFDFSGLNFIDQTGLSVMVGAKKRFRSFGGDVFCIKGPVQIMKVFRITGLDNVFTFFDTQDEALRLCT